LGKNDLNLIEKIEKVSETHNRNKFRSFITKSKEPIKKSKKKKKKKETMNETGFILDRNIEKIEDELTLD